MLATITDIQGKDELTQVLEVIANCNGNVVAKEEADVETVVRAEFNDRDDEDKADVTLCDLGFMVDWDEKV